MRFGDKIILQFKTCATAQCTVAASRSITFAAQSCTFSVALVTLKVLFSIAIRASNLLGVTTNCAIINTGCEQKQHTKCHC